MAYRPARYFLVAAKDEDGYVLATRRQFRTRPEAELYTQSVAASRSPIVIQVD